MINFKYSSHKKFRPKKPKAFYQIKMKRNWKLWWTFYLMLLKKLLNLILANNKFYKFWKDLGMGNNFEKYFESQFNVTVQKMIEIRLTNLRSNKNNLRLLGRSSWVVSTFVWIMFDPFDSMRKSHFFIDSNLITFWLSKSIKSNIPYLLK